MKRFTISLILLALACSAMNARNARRCYNDADDTFCVSLDGRLMTVKQYDDWLYKNHPTEYLSDTVMAYWMKRHLKHQPQTDSRNYKHFTFVTRTMQWGSKLLTAWAILDDQGMECSHWVFAGSADGEAVCWVLCGMNDRYVEVILIECADTACWTWGRIDRNGRMYMRVAWDEYIPWNWKLVGEIL